MGKSRVKKSRKILKHACKDEKGSEGNLDTSEVQEGLEFNFYVSVRVRVSTDTVGATAREYYEEPGHTATCRCC